MSSNIQQSLSFIEVLTRNLFLLTLMCICLGLGFVIHLFDIDSLDTYLIQIRSNRLDFIFFIGVAACYIPLLFIFIEKYWLNFLAQISAAIVLFVLLVLIFNPALKLQVHFLGHHAELSTRSWGETKNLPVAKIANLSKLQMPKEKGHVLLKG